ncbi:uncharacterized protein [Dendropsophus ebraccatus]|uniref:uncharacterized protein isoform X1 n=1 Tax=Dendropsophus ebraccatus TaxID=150705 RepID=UPI00383105D0
MMEAPSVLVLYVLCMLCAWCFGVKEVTETSVTSGIVTPSGQDGGQNSGGIIILIVAAVLVFVAIILCAIYWIRRRRRHKLEGTELREVIVHNPDVPEVDIIPDVAIGCGDEAAIVEEAEPVIHRLPHIEITTMIKKMADFTSKPKKRPPVAMTLHEKTEEIKRKKRFRFKRFRSFFKIQRKRSLTRSQKRKERDEKCRQVGRWLERRRNKKNRIEERTPRKSRRSSLLCCG